MILTRCSPLLEATTTTAVWRDLNLPPLLLLEGVVGVWISGRARPPASLPRGVRPLSDPPLRLSAPLPLPPVGGVAGVGVEEEVGVALCPPTLLPLPTLTLMLVPVTT